MFDGILVYVSHEGFNGWFWNFEIGKFVNGMLVYASSYSDCDGNKGMVSIHYFAYC